MESIGGVTRWYGKELPRGARQPRPISLTVPLLNPLQCGDAREQGLVTKALLPSW